MLLERYTCTLFLFAKDATDFVIDCAGHLVRVFASAGHQIFTEEYLLLASKGHWANSFAHAPFANHSSSDACCLLEIVCGTTVEVSENHHFGYTTTHGFTDDILEILA